MMRTTFDLLLPRLAYSVLVACLMQNIGCNGGSTPSNTPPKSEPNPSRSEQTPAKNADNAANADEPKEFLVNAEQLIQAQLPEELLKEGWVSLFDGQSLFGWFIVDKANWRVEDGLIKVDRGDKSYLCSSLAIADGELHVEFRCDEKTNSGIFLRTQPSPGDVSQDCLELNIAPSDNPFPTGSLVERQKVDEAAIDNLDATQWHTFDVRMDGNKIEISLDGKAVQNYTDDTGLGAGHISLQHNQGAVAFRNLRFRPLPGKPLELKSNWESDWTLAQKDGAQFQAQPTEEGLKITGGTGQVQSKGEWADFMLQACYQIAKPEVNSGIFFRCVRDAILDGYECQVNHAIKGDDPLQPADGGAGAIFRRQTARIVLGNGEQPTYVTIYARGPQILTWVNGVQMVDFVDNRPVDDNPRKGLRTAAGPIALQGHDATTDALFRSLQIVELRK